MAQDITIEQLAEQVVDAFLEERILDRKTLIPKMQALIRTMVNLKNIPNYNKPTKPDKFQAQLIALERRAFEIKYWINIVKELDLENMEKYYSGQQQNLINHGFII